MEHAADTELASITVQDDRVVVVNSTKIVDSVAYSARQMPVDSLSPVEDLVVLH